MDMGNKGRRPIRGTDYGSRPAGRAKFRIVRTDELVEVLAGSGTPPAKKLGRKQKLLVAAVVILIAAATIGLIVWRDQASRFTLPAEYSKNAGIDIYIPKRLPEGYTLKTNSLQSDGGVVIFAINDTDSHRIVFSEQSKPETFDFQNFYDKVLKNSRKLDGTPYPATIGTGEKNSKILSIEAGKTWVIISAQAQTPDSALVQIAQQMHQQK
jgi:hypothetical protein